MAVLALHPAVRVVVVLRVGLAIEHVAFRVVLELVEGTLRLEALADDVEAGLPEHPVALVNLPARFQHRFEGATGQVCEIGRRKR